jgi:lysophospholipase L1-like esterase
MPTTRPPIPQADRKPEPVGDPSVAAPRSGSSAADFMKAHERLLARTKQGNIDLLLLGDSLTQFWEKYPDAFDKAFGDYKPANYGVAGDRVENLQWRIENGELEGLKPKVILLMIGTNNTGINSADQIAAGISHTVQTLRSKCPDARILLLSILPRAREGEEAKSDAINSVNSALSKLDDGNNVKYIDLAAKFRNADGKIPRDLMVDGMHLTGKGYAIWGDTLEDVLKPLMVTTPTPPG